MKNFNNVEDLTDYMFKKINGEAPVSVVADKELSATIMKELLNYDDVNLVYVDINSWEYDKEYIVTLCRDCDEGYWSMSIEPMYHYDCNEYFATDGYILFHEDVSSKALIDVQNNMYVKVLGYDWFVIGEDEDEYNCDDYNISEQYSCSHSKNVEYSEENDGDWNGFSFTKTDGDSCISFTMHTTEKVDKNDIRSLLKEFGF